MKRVFSILLLGLLFLVSLLPFWMLFIIADVLYIILYYIVGYRRRVVDQNLLNAFPEKSAEERALIRRKYFRYLADLIVETVKLLTISRQEVAKRVFAVNPDLIGEAFRNGQSVLGILVNYGNWELNGLRFSQLYHERRAIVYKPLSNPLFDEALMKMRSRFGATLVNMKSTARKLVQYRINAR